MSCGLLDTRAADNQPVCPNHILHLKVRFARWHCGGVDCDRSALPGKLRLVIIVRTYKHRLIKSEN
ncbi:hypothetical protein ABIF64_000994 [Bradyrhizobium japonicum]